MLKIQSVNVGSPRDVQTPDGRRFFSGIAKKPIVGKIYLDLNGLSGDGVGNTKVHGGSDKALCLYCVDHFSFWKEELGIELEPGAFGENLSIAGLSEADVYIGDVLRIGEVQVQCSQPRQPCRNLSSFRNEPNLVERIRQTGYSGFYMRVLQPGWISTEDSVEFVSSRSSQFSIHDVNILLYQDKKNFDMIRQVIQLDSLAQSLRNEFQRRLDRADLHLF